MINVPNPNKIGCLKCKQRNILNLFIKGRGNFGGEFSVLQTTFSKKDNINCYCTSGMLLCLCCHSMIPMENSEQEYLEFYEEIFWEAHTNLRTSLFLVINGHYKGAFQMLRAALENLIVGFYLLNFEEIELKERSKKYKSYKKGKLSFKIEFITDVQKILKKNKLMTLIHVEKIRKTYDDLCIYVHPNPKGFSCENKKHNCTFSVEYDIRQLNKWRRIFQDLIFYFLLMYINTFLKIEDIVNNSHVYQLIENLLGINEDRCKSTPKLKLTLKKTLEVIYNLNTSNLINP